MVSVEDVSFTTLSPISPELLLASRGQVAVDESERCTVEHEGHSHGSFVPCKQARCYRLDCVFMSAFMTGARRPVETWKRSPKVLAIPVFTLSENTWEILFSCSGLARTMIRMFHRVWVATWETEICHCFSPEIISLSLFLSSEKSFGCCFQI